MLPIDAVDRYAAISALQTRYSRRTGLLPDFVVTSEDGSPIPADGEVLESSHDGDYSYNACRTPWRIGFDAIVSGDSRSLAAARRMNTVQECRGRPGRTGNRLFIDRRAVRRRFGEGVLGAARRCRDE